MSFRLQGRVLALTWPRCLLDKEAALQILLSKGALKAVVAREEHADGVPHLHAWVDMGKRIDWTNPNCLDLTEEWHGNYQVARSPKDWMTYVTKGGTWVAHPKGGWPLDVTSGKEKVRTTKTDVLAEAILSGSVTYSEVRKTHPGFWLLHKRKLKEAFSEMELERLSSSKRCPKMLVKHLKEAYTKWNADKSQTAYELQSIHTIMEWLFDNFETDLKDLPFRSKQLYLYGDPGVGKSRFIGRLKEWMNGYQIPRGIEFYDLYQDGAYNFAYLDEFKGQKTVQFLNTWLDGNEFVLNKKGEAPVVKTDQLPTVTCSNLPAWNVFHLKVQKGELDQMEVNAYCDRLLQVQVTKQTMDQIDALFDAANQLYQEGTSKTGTGEQEPVQGPSTGSQPSHLTGNRPLEED